MKVLVDTNIILDCLLERLLFYDESKRVLEYCLFLVDGYIAGHAFTDMFFTLHEREKRSVEYCRNSFIKLCKTFEVCAVDKQKVLDAAHNMAFEDFEDALQAECALSANVDYIITRNPKDFEGSFVPVIPPEEFLMIMERIK
ncbi:MAG: PIN domain-containing protein [Spirochaetales bacterium]|nr:PIN domain-containing protein [Spirochaetales bacterium]